MKLRKKALLPAIAMVLASVIALSGVTYAWFTTGTNAQVDSLDVNVATASGIQVSLDASSWKSTLKTDDFVKALSGDKVTLQYPMGSAEIAPVSTAGVIDTATGRMKMFYGEFNKDGTLKSEAEAESHRSSGGNFVAFDLFIKSSTENQALTLKLGDSLSFVKGVDLATKTEDGKVDATTIGTEKAVRVAFVVYSGASATADAARANKNVSEVMIWEPNNATRADGVPEGTESGVLTYSGFNQEFKSCSVEELASKGYVTKMTTFNEDKDIITLQPGINKIRVYIWLEGQDVDCVNDISFGDFRVNLYFSIPGDVLPTEGNGEG